jgi:hypothetical protein
LPPLVVRLAFRKETPETSSAQVLEYVLPTVRLFHVELPEPPPAQKWPPLVLMVVPSNCILPWSVLEEDMAVLNTKFKDVLLEEILIPDAAIISLTILKVSVLAVEPVYTIDEFMFKSRGIPLTHGSTMVRSPIPVRWFVITLGCM